MGVKWVQNGRKVGVKWAENGRQVGGYTTTTVGASPRCCTVINNRETSFGILRFLRDFNYAQKIFVFEP